MLSRLDVHLDRLSANWEGNGGKVFFAADASEATEYVLGIAARVEAKLVVKSKSMASEEIKLNNALIDRQIEPVETDLGSSSSSWQANIQATSLPPLSTDRRRMLRGALRAPRRENHSG